MNTLPLCQLMSPLSVNSAKQKTMGINETRSDFGARAQNLADIRCRELHCLVPRAVARDEDLSKAVELLLLEPQTSKLPA